MWSCHLMMSLWLVCFSPRSHIFLVIRVKPFEDVLIAVSQFALLLTVVRPEIIWSHSSFVLLTDILGIIFKPLFSFQLLTLQYHDNILLARLSRRLTRWAYSIPMVRRPSVVVVVRRPHFQTWISLKPVGQSWSNFMCTITGVGERLHKVLGQIGSKLWFPWQQKAPIDL